MRRDSLSPRRERTRQVNKMMNVYRSPYQQVDFGITFSTPVNVANTLSNSLVGPLSIVLVIIFTGTLIYALFYPYFIGKNSFVHRSNEEGQSSHFASFLNRLNIEEAFDYLSDGTDDDDKVCRRKILCHLHSYLPHTPRWFQTAFRLIRFQI